MWVITDRLHPNPAARLYHDTSVGASPLPGASDSKGVSPCFRTIPGTEITSDWPSQDAFIAAPLASPTTTLCTHDPVVLRRCPPTVTPAIRTQRTVVAPMATSVSTELPRELVLDP
jgi:hypothetical protein